MKNASFYYLPASLFPFPFLLKKIPGIILVFVPSAVLYLSVLIVLLLSDLFSIFCFIFVFWVVFRIFHYFWIQDRFWFGLFFSTVLPILFFSLLFTDFLCHFCFWIFVGLFFTHAYEHVVVEHLPQAQHSTARHNKLCTQQQSNYVPIRAWERNQVGRVGESEDAVENSQLAVFSKRRNQN